jgi:hypothetical protein
MDFDPDAGRDRAGRDQSEGPRPDPSDVVVQDAFLLTRVLSARATNEASDPTTRPPTQNLRPYPI